ncbi:P22AR C-terminal domain-containing protein [Klebsiella pneumoniae]|uniref:P22AR C-terminal domain-containing protein n=1 Tax=Klebsiella pneumoniae TaxID=573 RepID=UPI003B5C3975
MPNHKNDEALTTCDSQGSLSNKSRKGNIDMNIVQNKELSFHNTNFAYMEMGGQVWLTAAEVGQALEYADDKAVQRIYSRHADEFTAQMTGVVKLTTPSGKQESRVFSLRGAHLVAMFARTPKAKEFRRWVLDILDREMAHSPIAKQFSDEELCSLSYLWRSSAVMYEACHNIYPLLLAAEHKLLPRFASIVTNHARTINRTRDLLRRETKHIEEHPWGDTNWKNVFSYGTGVLQ